MRNQEKLDFYGQTPSISKERKKTTTNSLTLIQQTNLTICQRMKKKKKRKKKTDFSWAKEKSEPKPKITRKPPNLQKQKKLHIINQTLTNKSKHEIKKTQETVRAMREVLGEGEDGVGKLRGLIGDLTLKVQLQPLLYHLEPDDIRRLHRWLRHEH